MSDTEVEPVEEKKEEPVVDTELEGLKERAKVMGIRFHPSIKLEALKAKVNAILKSKEKEEKKKAKVVQNAASNAGVVVPIRRKLSKVERIRRDALRLVRVRVACMNPNKREWEGEVIAARNKYTGSVKKYIPFNADSGWHVPYILYKRLLDKKCQIFVNITDASGNKMKQKKQISEYSVEVMKPLTDSEIKELAAQQARGSIDG